MPWALAFPKGLPPTTERVHPTQIYEAIGLALLAWALVRWRRRGIGDVSMLARYSILAGGLRFAIEFLRVNRPVLLGLTLAHSSLRPSCWRPRAHEMVSEFSSWRLTAPAK